MSVYTNGVRIRVRSADVAGLKPHVRFRFGRWYVIQRDRVPFQWRYGRPRWRIGSGSTIVEAFRKFCESPSIYDRPLKAGTL